MKQTTNERSSSSACTGSLPDIAVTTVTGKEMNGPFSFIVDDVDAQSILQESSDASGLSSSSSMSSLDGRDELHERVKKIQVEAEARRWEFALLLEEHAQVVRKLKRMEAEEQLYLTTTTTTTAAAATAAAAAAAAAAATATGDGLEKTQA